MAASEASGVETLRRRVRELEEELRALRAGAGPGPRARIERMSPEVTDSNPYRCAGGGGSPPGRGREALLWGGPCTLSLWCGLPPPSPSRVMLMAQTPLRARYTYGAVPPPPPLPPSPFQISITVQSPSAC